MSDAQPPAETTAPNTPPATAPNAPAQATTAPVTQPNTQPDAAAPPVDTSAAAPPVEAPAYKIPDAYKDKPWAAKIKSEDDLYKQIENLTGVVGKKTIVPDFDNAPDDEIEAYISKTRPADKNAYDFGEGADPAFIDPVRDMLFDAGLPKKIGDKIIKNYQAHEVAKLAELTSAEGFEAAMSETFGKDDYKRVIAAGEGAHKKIFTPEQLATIDKLPNIALPAIYKLTDHYEKEIAALKKQYGVNEDVDKTGKTGAAAPVDLNVVRKDLRDQIAKIDKRPHTADEKQQLIDKLQSTYKK